MMYLHVPPINIHKPNGYVHQLSNHLGTPPFGKNVAKRSCSMQVYSHPQSNMP